MKKALGFITLSAGLAFAACGDDTDATNNGGANNGTNNGMANNGGTNNGGTNNGGTNNGGTNNGMTNNGMTNNGMTNNGGTNNGMTNNMLMCSAADPGSDIMWSNIVDDTGTNVLGWGFAVDVNIENVTENGCQSVAHLDGTEPLYAWDSECPEFSEDTVVALGMGGHVVLAFDDGTGTAVSLDSDMTLTVGEFGAQCPTGTAADDYEVFLCTDQGPEMGDLSSCTVSLGVGSGETTFQLLDATGIETYVMIEDFTTL